MRRTDRHARGGVRWGISSGHQLRSGLLSLARSRWRRRGTSSGRGRRPLSRFVLPFRASPARSPPRPPVRQAIQPPRQECRWQTASPLSASCATKGNVWGKTSSGFLAMRSRRESQLCAWCQREPLRQGGFGRAMLFGARGGCKSAAADIEGAAFVAEPRSAAAYAGRAAIGVAAKRGGARAGQQYDPLTGAEGGFEGDFEIRGTRTGRSGSCAQKRW
jgi:hypothetical protein